MPEEEGRNPAKVNIEYHARYGVADNSINGAQLQIIQAFYPARRINNP